ncbi:helix-turn-helix domain-containing protein [Natronomonas sp.]|jgi:predicted DNA binding protein|uniref:helix-turn-helix domain-containing protein n=1 Tax=Natronomonas sp. TaxID=2184060 RepID=UPI00398A4E23
MLRIKFQIRSAGIASKLFAIDEQVISVEIDNALPVTEGEVFLSLTVGFHADISKESLSNQLPNIQIIDMSEANVTPHTYYLSVLADLSDVSVLSLLTENKAIPHTIVGTDSHLDVVASVRDWTHLKEVAATIEDNHGSLELVGTTQTESIGFPLGSNKVKQSISGKLSDNQLEVLETAYRLGYFKVPQEVTAEEIAEELDISRSTLSERLRRVEHSFCALLFGPQE